MKMMSQCGSLMENGQGRVGKINRDKNLFKIHDLAPAGNFNYH
jgi:hypothetical protein